MHARRTTHSQDPGGRGKRRPRVVILDEGTSVRVAVLDLPDSTDVGTSFCHSGISWRIIGLRRSSRVFIAEREH